MATRNHTKGELLAQLEQARIEIQRLTAENRSLKNQTPKNSSREFGIPRSLRDAFFHATGLCSATPQQIKAWARALS